MTGRSCGFCPNPSGYTCPRCSTDYCGLKCYQSSEHRPCSENFYKECVQAELVGGNLGAESKVKMVDILKRMSEEKQDEEDEMLDSDDDEDEIDLVERLKGVDLENTELVWSLLSKDERKQFDNLVQSGDFSSVLPEYTPWWKNTLKVKKVKEITEPDLPEDLSVVCPKVCPEIPSLKTLCKQPSPWVKFGLLNLLYAYAYAVQYFGGDYTDKDFAQFVEIVQLLAKTLEGHNFELADTALETAASQVNSHQWLTISLQHSRNVKKDVYHIVKGPTGQDNFYILSALSDLKTIFEGVIKTLKKRKKEEAQIKENPTEHPFWLKTLNQQPVLDIGQVKKHLKKIEFYLSWSNEFYDVFKEL